MGETLLKNIKHQNISLQKNFGGQQLSLTTKVQEMLSAKCSSHFMEVYSECKRSMESEEDQQLKEKTVKYNRRSIIKPVYDYTDCNISSGNSNSSNDSNNSNSNRNSNSDSSRNSNSSNVSNNNGNSRNNSSISSNDSNNSGKEDEEEEVINIWRCSSREKKRQSLTIESLSQTNIERLQRIHVRRKTLPENIFSQLKVKCKHIQSQRSILTQQVTQQPQKEQDEGIKDVVFSGGELTFEEQCLPEPTRSLLCRRRKLFPNISTQNQTDFHTTMKLKDLQHNMMMKNGSTLPQIKTPLLNTTNISTTLRRKMGRQNVTPPNCNDPRRITNPI